MDEKWEREINIHTKCMRINFKCRNDFVLDIGDIATCLMKSKRWINLSLTLGIHVLATLKTLYCYGCVCGFFSSFGSCSLVWCAHLHWLALYIGIQRSYITLGILCFRIRRTLTYIRKKSFMCIILGSLNIFDLWTLDVTLTHKPCKSETMPWNHPRSLSVSFATRSEHLSNLFWR